MQLQQRLDVSDTLEVGLVDRVRQDGSPDVCQTTNERRGFSACESTGHLKEDSERTFSASEALDEAEFGHLFLVLHARQARELDVLLVQGPVKLASWQR